MPIVHLNKATDLAPSADCVHINTDAILFVEESPGMQMGKTAIHLMGLKNAIVRVTETLDQVLAKVPGLVQAHRHFHAGEPSSGDHAVHVAVQNVSYERQTMLQGQPFWTIRFKDEYELRVIEPLPVGL